MIQIVERQPYLHQMKQLDLMHFLTDDEINEFLTYAEVIA